MNSHTLPKVLIPFFLDSRGQKTSLQDGDELWYFHEKKEARFSRCNSLGQSSPLSVKPYKAAEIWAVELTLTPDIFVLFAQILAGAMGMVLVTKISGEAAPHDIGFRFTVSTSVHPSIKAT